MATVTRQDGTKITINDAITKTSFSSISAGTVVTQAYLDSLTTAITKLEGYAAKVDNCGYTNCCESCQDSCTCQSSKNQSCQNTCTCQSDKNQGCQNTCTKIVLTVTKVARIVVLISPVRTVVLTKAVKVPRTKVVRVPQTKAAKVEVITWLIFLLLI